ncbi:TonB-dependent receptor, partial [Pseudoxanthomonas sp. SGD-10]
NDGFNWNGNINTTINITKQLAGQANFFYMAPRTLSQGTMKEMTGLDAGLKYDIMNRKASIGFNVQDVFDSRRFGMNTMNETFIQDFQRRRLGRIYNLSISYRFGRSDLQTEKRNQRRPNEAPAGDEEMGF